MIVGLLMMALTAVPPAMYRVALETPGGDLPFVLELRLVKGQLEAFVHNPPEIIALGPVAAHSMEELRVELPHYDSVIEARFSPDRRTFAGTWTKQRAAEKAVLKLKAELHAPRFPVQQKAAKPWAPRWRTQFSSSDEPAVLELTTTADGTATGTFLTTTGDYRFLTGRVDGDQLQLSCFDGAHAFLFRATRSGNQLRGDFWSGAHWHENWTGAPDPDVQLPDAFEQTKWVGGDLSKISFPDLSGTPRSLTDPALRGKVTVLEIFGSWCPNCHDAAVLLSEFESDYADRGLKIVGLAFELTGRFERDAEQVRRYLNKYDLRFPVLIAGRSDKKQASERVPFLDRVRSYPTLVLLDQSGTCRAVYTGWTGPATGAAYERLERSLRQKIEALLAE